MSTILSDQFFGLYVGFRVTESMTSHRIPRRNRRPLWDIRGHCATLAEQWKPQLAYTLFLDARFEGSLNFPNLIRKGSYFNFWSLLYIFFKKKYLKSLIYSIYRKGSPPSCLLHAPHFKPIYSIKKIKITFTHYTYINLNPFINRNFRIYFVYELSYPIKIQIKSPWHNSSGFKAAIFVYIRWLQLQNRRLEVTVWESQDFPVSICFSVKFFGANITVR